RSVLPETLPESEREDGNLVATIKNFSVLIQDRVFIGIALAQAFASTSMFAYISGSPFILQNIYGVPPLQFSIIFAINGVGIIISAQLTGKLSSTLEESRVRKSVE